MSFTAFMLDVITDTFYPARITIEDGKYKEITPIFIDEDTKLDMPGLMMPGFIDSHIHIESSMMTPAQFAKVAVRHGTTGVVCDPHEIANVLGIEGIEAMIENAKQVPFNFFFSAPSCVPATPFETSGAVIDSADINYLLKKDEIVGLGEMMNFPGVINGDEEVLKKLKLARIYNKPIDGHAPLLSGEELNKYLKQQIVTDHECSNILEAFEKKIKGMKIMVRDGSSALDMENLFNIEDIYSYIEDPSSLGVLFRDIFELKIYAPLFDFIVSDDKNPNDLLEGHLNKSVKKACELGIDIVKAINMVTINPAYHYNLNCGAIVVGANADFVLVDSIYDLNILETYIGGECVFDGENVLFDAPEVDARNSINATKKSASDFDILYDGDECEVNVIECIDGDLLTKKATAKLKTKDGIVQPDIIQDVLKIAVVERYGGNNVSNAFAVVSEDFSDSLPLPIAGLMSNEDAEIIAEKLTTLQNMAAALGSNLTSPFMTMAFMALLVIPSLKISDLGLFDGDAFEFIDVIRN